MPNLPRELEIWNAMGPMQRYDVMKRVPFSKNTRNRFHACLAYIRANLTLYGG